MPIAAWLTDRLEIRSDDTVLEVGFGPGVVIQRLAKLAVAGHVAGIDQSRDMVQQARARKATAVQEGRVELRHGSVESLPFDSNRFDKVLAINSMQYWPQVVAGLRANKAGLESWRKYRAWLYPLFRAAE
jgi:ubiquinone/menaquinone biosynthesis C-methylase UbiE